MPTDPRLEPWLDEWEVRQGNDPSLTPERFLAELDASISPALRDDLRRLLSELAWIDANIVRLKQLDRAAEAFRDGFDPNGSNPGK